MPASSASAGRLTFSAPPRSANGSAAHSSGRIIAANVGWVVGFGRVLLLSGYVSPTWLGYAFVIAQALAVDIFAGLQMFAMWKYEKRTNVTA
jgi:hypothetical protein